MYNFGSYFMIDIGNLLYKEDEHMRTFLNETFNFAYDKDTFTSMSWGKTKDEDINFNPLGPEMIVFNIGQDYVFNESFKNLISLNTGDDSSFASVLTNVRLMSKNFDFLYSNEVKKLVEWLEKRSIFVEYCVSSSYVKKFKNIIKMKSFGIKNARIIANSIDFLNETIKRLVENNINSTLEIHLKDDIGFEDFIKSFSQAINADIIFTDSLKKESIEKICSLLKNTLSIRIKNDTLKKVGTKYENASMSEYSMTMFDCVFDFENDSIPLGREKNPIRLSECNSIDDYWYSTSFKKTREKILKKLN